jgi:hypothetical protein
MTDDLNDSLDALFAGDTGPVRTYQAAAPVDYTPAVERFTENCPNCRGSGRVVGGGGWGGGFLIKMPGKNKKKKKC